MVYFIIGSILVFNYSIMRVASRCSRVEEEIELGELLNKRKI